MAGRGPAPKRSRQRARDETPSELLPAAFTGAVPPLPASYRVNDGHNDVDRRFLKTTREWYGRWAASPMAATFTAVDWDRLRFVIAPLFDRYVRTSGRELAAELRLQEGLLGATVTDRMRLRMRVDAEPVEEPVSGADAVKAEFDELLAKRMSRGG